MWLIKTPSNSEIQSQFLMWVHSTGLPMSTHDAYKEWGNQNYYRAQPIFNVIVLCGTNKLSLKLSYTSQILFCS